MLEKTFPVGPFQCNCRLLVCPQTGEGILVDPGDESERILKEIKAAEAQLGRPILIRYLAHTHGHLDHIGATRGVKEGLSILNSMSSQTPKIALHSGDEELYQNLQMQGNLFGMKFDAPLAVDHYLEDEEIIEVGALKFSVIHTPGHSPGSVCIRLHEDSSLKSSETVLSGDTLFRGSVGRTDLWGANQEEMFKSIRQRILVLDDDTRVCPGHGPNSSIGLEKRENPFLK
jgi:glyoxylase-like metal-dependent hydrolase (beta-lactamase superfamily II)